MREALLIPLKARERQNILFMRSAICFSNRSRVRAIVWRMGIFPRRLHVWAAIRFVGRYGT